MLLSIMKEYLISDDILIDEYDEDKLNDVIDELGKLLTKISVLSNYIFLTSINLFLNTNFYLTETLRNDLKDLERIEERKARLIKLLGHD